MNKIPRCEFGSQEEEDDSGFQVLEFVTRANAAKHDGMEVLFPSTQLVFILVCGGGSECCRAFLLEAAGCAMKARTGFEVE